MSMVAYGNARIQRLISQSCIVEHVLCTLRSPAIHYINRHGIQLLEHLEHVHEFVIRILLHTSRLHTELISPLHHPAAIRKAFLQSVHFISIGIMFCFPDDHSDDIHSLPIIGLQHLQRDGIHHFDHRSIVHSRLMGGNQFIHLLFFVEHRSLRIRRLIFQKA